MPKKTLLSQTPIYSGNARMKYTHHESSPSVQKKLVTPYHLTEITTPKSSGSPTQVAGIEMECMVNVTSHKAMTNGQAQVIDISKCPEIPDLGCSKRPREDPTVTLSRNSYHSITYKRRRQQ